MALPAAEEVIHFWFGLPPSEEPRAEWFRKDEAFDERIRARFGTQVEAALKGELRAWDATPSGALARILLLDQFTRNLFRGSAKAFAGDVFALAAAQAMVVRGDDRWLSGVMRSFVYLPFEHSEDIDVQRESLRLFARLGAECPEMADNEVWAKKHEVIIARFGRFPHRNEALGRVSTAEELAFLKEPGSSF
ncbi:MAG: DUF924 domain-containing protein [Burkholderiales bacterium]|nr:DUF924 domain-containing protein [Burkholderiales bacterium]